MKKFIFLSLFLMFFLGTVGVNLAVAQAGNGLDKPPAEEVTTVNLGIENPGLLPTNPFYFFKEWGRKIKMFFTPDQVNKLKYQLEIVNQKAAELKRLQEIKSNDLEAIRKALDNYNKSVANLKARLESLKETSTNPNVDRLLTDLMDRAVKHQQLFEGLIAKHKDLRERVEQVRQNVEGVLKQVMENIDQPEKIEKRLREAVGDGKGDKFSGLRSLEFLERLKGIISKPEVVDRLVRLEEEQVKQSETNVGNRQAEVTICSEQYDPVCGADGKTYTNSCFARLAKVSVKYQGECGKSQSGKVGSPESSPTSPNNSSPSFTIEVGEPVTLVTPRVWNVEITVDGFSPKELKIKKGDTVLWINKTKKASWPASAVHPTHNVYPEKGGCLGSAFDACRGLGEGEVFKFTFNYAGSWQYHDHLNPASTGVIIVE